MIHISDVYLIIIIFLLVYNFYLLHQLNKNKALIISIKKLLNIEKQYSKEEYKKLLKRIAIFDFSLIVPKEKILDKEVYNYIFDNENKTMLFLHYTNELEIANQILKEGFKYKNSFYKTAENIFSDKIDFLNKHMRHKHFGKYIIILSISKKTYNYYLNEISKKSKQELLIEHVFSLNSVITNDNEDKIYTIPTQFVKGYVNYETGLIMENPNFNYNFDSEMFKSNILLSKNIKNN